MEEKPTEHIEVPHHHPNYNYASSTEDTIAHDDNFGRNGTYGETDVNQVNIQGKHANAICLSATHILRF